jgi:hypothetical protein
VWDRPRREKLEAKEAFERQKLERKRKSEARHVDRMKEIRELERMRRPTGEPNPTYPTKATNPTYPPSPTDHPNPTNHTNPTDLDNPTADTARRREKREDGWDTRVEATDPRPKSKRPSAGIPSRLPPSSSARKPPVAPRGKSRVVSIHVYFL